MGRYDQKVLCDFPDWRLRPEIGPWAFQQPKKNRRNEKLILAMKRKHTKTYQKKTSKEKFFPVLS